jgi:undecaprenyl-diphosphatase
MNVIRSLDTKLLLFINHGTANALFDILMPLLSARGYYLILPYVLFMLWIGSSRKNPEGKTYLTAALWTLLISCCSVFIAEWTEYILKYAIMRIRPCQALEGIRLIVPCPSSYSMPSGHAISSFAFAVPLLYLTRAYMKMIWRLYPLVLASLIVFSRVYLGVHYPTDVLAGALFGAMIALLLSLLYNLIESKRAKPDE